MFWRGGLGSHTMHSLELQLEPRRSVRVTPWQHVAAELSCQSLWRGLMVALKSERRVYLWRMSPHASPKEAPVDVKFEQILQILKTAFDNKEAFAHVDAQGKVVPSDEAAENCIFIADINESTDGKTCTILINRGDPDVAHPSFINPKAQTVKHVPPGRGEVQGWSAHMVIRSAPDGTKGHRAAFERMQNVSSTLVQRYIDALVDKATEGKAEFTYEKS